MSDYLISHEDARELAENLARSTRRDARVLALLKRIEWDDIGGSSGRCPSCHQFQLDHCEECLDGGHLDECELAALIQELSNEP